MTDTPAAAELAKRLRACQYQSAYPVFSELATLCQNAADLLESQAARIAELEVQAAEHRETRRLIFAVIGGIARERLHKIKDREKVIDLLQEEIAELKVRLSAERQIACGQLEGLQESEHRLSAENAVLRQQLERATASHRSGG